MGGRTADLDSEDPGSKCPIRGGDKQAKAQPLYELHMQPFKMRENCFSAFWLRSSVVSVLTSLKCMGKIYKDMRKCLGQDVK